MGWDTPSVVGAHPHPAIVHPRWHLVGRRALAEDEGLAQLQAGGDALGAGFDLTLETLVVVHQQLHRGDVPTSGDGG